MARTLLIEIGTEEIPANYLGNAASSFAEGLKNLFNSERISYSTVETLFTPRRVTVIFQDVSEEQGKIIKKIKGPPIDAAFKDGKPTSSAEGFAGRVGIPLDSLQTEKFNGREYVIALVEEESRVTTGILQDNLQNIIKNIQFPKKMRWEETNFLFARPIRWIVALLGDEQVKFSIAGVKSGKSSRGHRLLAPESIEVATGNYVERLKDSYVMVDPNDRKEKLEKMIRGKAKEVGGEPVLREELLDEVTNLIEYPFVIMGSFDRKFLNLPKKVIITAMETHQRYFPVKKDDKLVPYFISAVNNIPDDSVIRGNEKVLMARLEDAGFYWEVDKKIPLSERVPELSGIMWHKSLGTLLDRTGRLIKLSEWIGERVDDVDLKVIMEGARLAKADLTTLMIRDGKEFTNLEGYIGACYALEEGVSEEICKVIEGHYRPRNAMDGLPETKEAGVVSLADRIDLVVGSFLVGEKPTGSRDPLGLRQAFNGFIRIVVGFGFEISLKDLIERSVLELSIEANTEIVPEISKFIKDRIEGYLQSVGIRYDIANAVLSEGWDNVLTATIIAKSMMEFRKDEKEFERLVIGQKRVSNILKGWNGGETDESLLCESEEKELYRKARDIEPNLGKLLKRRNYLEALSLLKKLRPFIDNLFDNVLVMADDDKLRNNRLALLYYVRSLFHLLADFEEIVID